MSVSKRIQLTPTQEAFAQAIVDGHGPSDAYRKAGYSNSSPKLVSIAAAKIQRHPAVKARIADLRARLTNRKTLERVEKREMLATFIRAKIEKVPEHLGPGVIIFSREQLSALEIDNRMAGHNEAEKLKVTGMGSVLQKIRRDAPKP